MNPSNGDSYFGNVPVLVAVSARNGIVASADVYINGDRVGALDPGSMSFEFVPGKISNLRNSNTLRVVATSDTGEKTESSVVFKTTSGVGSEDPT
jgi:hypothetical protein